MAYTTQVYNEQNKGDVDFSRTGQWQINQCISYIYLGISVCLSLLLVSHVSIANTDQPAECGSQTPINNLPF